MQYNNPCLTENAENPLPDWSFNSAIKMLHCSNHKVNVCDDVITKFDIKFGDNPAPHSIETRRNDELQLLQIISEGRLISEYDLKTNIPGDPEYLSTSLEAIPRSESFFRFLEGVIIPDAIRIEKSIWKYIDLICRFFFMNFEDKKLDYSTAGISGFSSVHYNKKSYVSDMSHIFLMWTPLCPNRIRYFNPFYESIKQRNDNYITINSELTRYLLEMIEKNILLVNQIDKYLICGFCNHHNIDYNFITGLEEIRKISTSRFWGKNLEK